MEFDILDLIDLIENQDYCAIGQLYGAYKTIGCMQ